MKMNHMTIQADVLAEIHFSRRLNANISHATLTNRHITKHIWRYKPNSADCTALLYVCLKSHVATV